MKRIAAMLYITSCMFGCSVVAQTAPAEPASACTATGDIRLICGDSAPEDMLAVPETNWIIASAFNGSGGLWLVDGRTKQSRVLRLGADIDERFDGTAYPDCPGPPTGEDRAKFVTHGLALRHGPKGSGDKIHTLYAVHHGGREAVEIFRLDTNKPSPKLTWTGCIIAPASVGLNSLAVLPKGGLLATNFLSRGVDQAEEFKKILAGEKNGELWEWQPGKGWSVVPGSEGSGVNGVEVSADGKTIYLAEWGGESFSRMSRTGGAKTRVTTPLGFRADNLRWTRDGLLLAGGQTDRSPQRGTKIVVVDPQTLAVGEVAAFPDQLAFSGGTVGLQNGDEVWIGSFGSPAIAIVKAPVRRPDNDASKESATVDQLR